MAVLVHAIFCNLNSCRQEANYWSSLLLESFLLPYALQVHRKACQKYIFNRSMNFLEDLSFAQIAGMKGQDYTSCL